MIVNPFLLVLVVFVSSLVGGLLGGWLVVEAIGSGGDIEIAVKKAVAEVYRGKR